MIDRLMTDRQVDRDRFGNRYNYARIRHPIPIKTRPDK